MANRFFPTLGATIALCAATLSTPALAGGFTPEGHDHWLQVAQGLTVAASAETEDMMTPCPGFSVMGGSSEIRHEYFQVPKWAVSAHAQTCFAYNTVSKGGKGFMHMNSGDACKFLKAAVGELAKAKPGADPDDVVAAAGKLRTALISLAADFHDAKACRLG